jgi:DNA-directed RNA polymerase subunit RPC12/RpoP
VERKSGRIRRVKYWQTILAAFKSPPVSQAKLNQLQAEAKEFFDKLVTTGKITIPDDIPLVLGTDETPLLHEPSKLIEARATRVYSGVGARAKGIYIGSGKSSSVQDMERLDSGMLTLTTKRLVFTGSMESRVVNIKDVVSIEAIPDGIEVSTGKKAKRQVYTVRNPLIWATLIRTAGKGGISATAIKPVAQPSDDIRFNCPQCGQHLTVEQKGAGMAVNCPSCNTQIEIPHSSAPA